ncbi:glycosyl transferase [Photobacterium aquimaris]|uniref:Glycosyl transferase n=1 Tax=Photobacterium aquimaris TaxID=512643 RepID=A0A2T3ITC7_9GAMM|nr:glycosyltransferase [Photobacterium aquimaris]OBU18376.1 glycosyl transferase [Photobacterium aquimaris]OBU20799.1 glycosyl transferase [Photobacterium aquimaris]PSU31611.1 glycosyl transferase [Photobacterium aquimaris]PSW03295.1 glycosyl transferase [Photobacterium aquimaris]
MKTIIHVVQHLSPGGLETMVLNMLSFSDPHYRVFICSMEATSQHIVASWRQLVPFKHQIIGLNKPPGLSLSTIKKLGAVFKNYQADIVHSHHIGPLLYTSCALQHHHYPIKHIHTEHDAWHLNSYKHRLIQYIALQLSNPTVVADADFVRKKIHKIFKNCPIYTIKNGINPSRFTVGNKLHARDKLALALPAGSIVIGNAARLETVKGQRYLIEALQLLPSHFHLLLAGSGSMLSELQQLVHQYNLEHRVHFLGHIDDMPTFYQALDLFCLPSNNEGFPLSTLEAQACGIPCVANNVGGVSETLSTDSLLVNDNTAVTLSNAIQSLPYHGIHHNARDFILKHNHAQTMTKAYEKLYFSGENI